MKPSTTLFFRASREHLLNIVRVYWTLVKIMFPALVAVKLLNQFGADQWLGMLLSPLMTPLGLPDTMSLVWASAILTNVYTGMAVFYQLAGDQVFSVAQMSVIGLLILLSHAIPTEGAVAKLVGVRWRVTIIMRLGGAYVLAWIMARIYEMGDWQGQPAVMLWQPEPIDNSWLPWLVQQGKLFASIFVIIGSLMTLLKLMRWLGIEALMQKLLFPLLRILKIGAEATHVTIIGITLGLSFGAGLLIEESRKGHIAKRDMALSVCFLGLAHSLVEDTLLILLLGTDIYAVLWARFLFAVIVIALMSRWLDYSERRRSKVEPVNQE